MSAPNKEAKAAKTVEAAPAFVVNVRTLDGERAAYELDRPRVVVGRGSDADLRVEHAAVSRAQFAIERVSDGGGPMRLRIVPLGGRNPTLVNGEPAIEGTILPGEQIAVGPLRFTVAPAKTKAKAPSSSRRVVLMGAATLLMAAMLLLGQNGGPATPAARSGLDAPLFHAVPTPACPSADGCAARARELYAKGRQYEELSGADGGNFYRAAVMFAYAARLREASGMPLGEMADARDRMSRAARKAEQLVGDARFQLQRAMTAGDGPRLVATLDSLMQLVPDGQHPIRLAIEMIRRDLQKQQTGAKK